MCATYLRGTVSGCHMPSGAPAFGHHSQPGSLSLRLQTVEFCRTVFLRGILGLCPSPLARGA